MSISNLSLEEKITQKLMFGVNSSNIDIIIKLIRDYKIGGVILYKKNYSNYNDMLSVIKRLKEANKNNKYPLFISIDQEGGRVNRMPSEFKVIRNNYDMSKKSIDLIYENGLITGKMLSSLGINMNFAPVLDICEDNGSRLLFNRCFYGNVDDIAKASGNYVAAQKNMDVISVVKHFPGHGVTRDDSHILPPYIFNYKEILNKHIKPFEELFKNNIDAMMVGHLIIRKMTYGLPASISYKFIKDIRNKYNYQGIVITDEVNMLSRSLIYNNKIVKNSLLSSDIVLIKLKDKYNKFIEKSINFIKKNPRYMEEIDTSVNRIIDTKKKYNITDDYESLGCNIDEINKEIDRINQG